MNVWRRRLAATPPRPRDRQGVSSRSLRSGEHLAGGRSALTAAGTSSAFTQRTTRRTREWTCWLGPPNRMSLPRRCETGFVRRVLAMLALTPLLALAVLLPTAPTDTFLPQRAQPARSLTADVPVRLPPTLVRRVARLRVDRLIRSYVVVSPARSVRPGGGTPGRSALLIVLPGWHQTAQKAERIEGWDRYVLPDHLVVIYASGYGGSWNAGTCCQPAVGLHVNDVAYMDAVLREAQQSYRIDPRRIYLAGFSNGGMMAYRYACERSFDLAAIAVASATLADPTCQPASPVSVLHVHGLRDATVPFAGTTFSRVLSQATESVRLALAPWYAVDAGTLASVSLTVLRAFDHRWPTLHNSGFDATTKALAFFRTHVRAASQPALHHASQSQIICQSIREAMASDLAAYRHAVTGKDTATSNSTLESLRANAAGATSVPACQVTDLVPIRALP